MARKAKKDKSAKAAKPAKAAKKNKSVAETLRAIRDETKKALSSGGSKPLNTVLALVETGLKQCSGKASE